MEAVNEVHGEVNTNTTAIVSALKFTLLASSISSVTATGKPASNITLSESMDNFDLLEIHWKTTSSDTYRVSRIKFDANGGIKAILEMSTMNTTEHNSIGFSIYRDSTTTMTAYYARWYKLDTTPAFSSGTSSTQEITAIYGIKY